MMLSFEPVFPVVIGLPNESSTVTPTLKEVPAPKLDAGTVVNTSRFSGPGLMVSVCKPDWRPDAEAVMIGEPAVVSP